MYYDKNGVEESIFCVRVLNIYDDNGNELEFNCGSSFGITGTRWIYVSKAATNTLNASIGGGLYSYFHGYFFNNNINSREWT